MDDGYHYGEDADLDHLFEVMEDGIEDNKRMLAAAQEGGLRYPPEIALTAAEAAERFCSQIAEIWLEMNGFDSPADFGKQEGVNAVTDDVMRKTIAWGQSAADAWRATAAPEPEPEER